MEGSELQKVIDKYFPYLLEIRKRLFFVAAIFLVFSLVGFIYYERIVKLILGIFNFEGVNVVFTSPFQFVNLAINSGLIVGLIVVFPLFIIQVLGFLKPALKKKEYKMVLSLLPASIFLFIVGFSFGIVVMRYVISIFYERSVAFSVGNLLDITLLLSQTLITSVLMGIGFQFPIVLTVLMRLKVIKLAALKKGRLLAYGVSIVFAALLPPTDLLSLVLLTLPLVILYEVTLLLNRKKLGGD